MLICWLILTIAVAFLFCLSSSSSSFYHHHPVSMMIMMIVFWWKTIMIDSDSCFFLWFVIFFFISHVVFQVGLIRSSSGRGIESINPTNDSIINKEGDLRIEGLKSSYQPRDRVNLTCQSGKSPVHSTPTKLTWLINNIEVRLSRNWMIIILILILLKLIFHFIFCL